MAINQKWQIRIAELSDTDQIMEAVRLLVAELRNVPKTTLPLSSNDVVDRLIAKSIPGAIFIAETIGDKKSCVGIITISVQEAIHVGGQYALIQELWVHPNYRNFAIGTQLMDIVKKFCGEHNLNNLEVCLPKKDFEKFRDTYNFYKKMGFKELGPRMRK
ncbi:MAG: GNAT family N-acetyltransferase [Tannerellaceae bacterium]|jgi:GNAT superfamily N-acetyltransferase|nr:GNAT family N-acetyltransferase [Tannerellaceae bacterium]